MSEEEIWPPICPDCGHQMEVMEAPLDSAWLPNGLIWAYVICPECGKQEKA